MNKFVLAKLSDRGEFRTSVKCDLLGTSVEHTNLKIDTGARGTLLPLRTVNFHSNFDISAYKDVNAFYHDYKKRLHDKGFAIKYLRGVTNSKKFPDNIKKIDRDDVIFACPILNLYVDDYFIFPKHEISVSCDTSGNVLLGMDILKNFDYHCGDSLVNDKNNSINIGNHIFIGCLQNDINEEYLEALKRYLGYT